MFTGREYSKSLLVTGVCVFGALTAFFVVYFSDRYTTLRSLNALTQCFLYDEKGDIVEDVACAQRAVAHALQSTSTEAVLDYVTSEDAPTIVRAKCHVISHYAGQYLYRASDASIEKALAQCTTACGSGCLHGVLSSITATNTSAGEEISHVSLAQISQVAEKYCSIRGVCHGLGHALYASSATLRGALRVCETFPGSSNQESCRKGVFMANTFGALPEMPPDLGGNSLAPASRIQRGEISCATLPLHQQLSCFKYSHEFPYMINDEFTSTSTSGTSQTYVSYCATLPYPTRAYCYEGIGRTAPEKMTEICEVSTQLDDQLACTLGFARRKLEGGRNETFRSMLSYCRSISDEPNKTLCYNVTFQSMENHGEGEYSKEQYCDKWEFKEECSIYLQKYRLLQTTLPNYDFGLYGEAVLFGSSTSMVQ